MNVSAPSEGHRCPNCLSGMYPFFYGPNVPTNSCIRMATAEAARACPRGDVHLGFCDACGFICNLAFDARRAEYDGRYEETQGFSPTFQRFHRMLAGDLVRRYGLQGRSALEIGCGKGEFLALLADQGLKSCLGFDPGFDDRRGHLDDRPGVRVIKDFYSGKYSGCRADFVCCKMTLEHITRPAEFIRSCRQALNPGRASVIYLQVPEARRILRDCAFEDIYYEHCNYFTAGSLIRMLRAQGFEIIRSYTAFADQYLSVEARLSDGPGSPAVPPEADDLPRLRHHVKTFSDRCDAKVEKWRLHLADLAEKGSVVLWGSGSKAVSFLSTVDAHGVVDRVVDINPYRQNGFMPGTAQPIIAPAALQGHPPAAVVVMNPIYRKEIAAHLDKLGIRAQVMAL